MLAWIAGVLVFLFRRGRHAGDDIYVSGKIFRDERDRRGPRGNRGAYAGLADSAESRQGKYSMIWNLNRKQAN